MQILLVVVVVVVIGVAIGHIVCSKDFQYDRGFRIGREDCKKGRRTRYQKFCLERRQKGFLTPYKKGYTEAYNCEMNNK